MVSSLLKILVSGVDADGWKAPEVLIGPRLLFCGVGLKQSFKPLLCSGNNLHEPNALRFLPLPRVPAYPKHPQLPNI